ncbi:hypothetical protein TNCV_2774921 [Trichonephila clavipes]|nr:hypothetical protein TNCV_2774921 [Trichonephila clavipes]
MVAVDLGPQQMGNRLTVRSTVTAPDSSLSTIRRATYTSPDLSSIKHVWDMMRMRLHLTGDVDDLAQLFEQTCREIPQKTIRMLCHSTSRHLSACIQDRDGSESY